MKELIFLSFLVISVTTAGVNVQFVDNSGNPVEAPPSGGINVKVNDQPIKHTVSSPDKTAGKVEQPKEAKPAQQAKAAPQAQQPQPKPASQPTAPAKPAAQSPPPKVENPPPPVQRQTAQSADQKQQQQPQVQKAPPTKAPPVYDSPQPATRIVPSSNKAQQPTEKVQPKVVDSADKVKPVGGAPKVVDSVQQQPTTTAQKPQPKVQDLPTPTKVQNPPAPAPKPQVRDAPPPVASTAPKKPATVKSTAPVQPQPTPKLVVKEVPESADASQSLPVVTMPEEDIPEEEEAISDDDEVANLFLYTPWLCKQFRGPRRTIFDPWGSGLVSPRRRPWRASRPV